MPNTLTGDFDLVVQFAVPAVNRFLAAMHRIERFPHSMAFRVDDTPTVDPHDRPPIVEIVDAFGDTVVDPRRVRVPALTETFGDGSSSSRFDRIVNADAIGIHLPPITPSNLRGRLLLQVSPPSVEIADATGTRVRVRMQVMSRYFPDAGTSVAAEFVRGELQLTATIAQIASQAANVVDFDVKAQDVGITFTPHWSSSALSIEDLAAVHLLIRNALKNSLLPSNATLPADVRVRFRTISGNQPLIAMLLNLSGTSGDPATAQNVFLGASDDFALAAGVDFIRAKFAGALDQILSQRIEPQENYGITYTFTLKNAAIDLETGRIVLTITGHAHTPSWFMPDFDFTLRQKFRLVPDGDTATLTIAEMSLSTTSTIVNWVKFLISDSISALRDQAFSQSGAVDAVRAALNATSTLGPLLRPLLTPARPKTWPIAIPFDHFRLAYSAADIRPAGIVLRGSLSVTDWPAPHIEFEEVAATATSSAPAPTGPEYSALKTWIPGGTIQSYEWFRLGQTPPAMVDDHTFVRLPPDPTVSTGGWRPLGAFHPLCLTVRGTRLSASGAVAAQPVVATSCAFNWFPLFGESAVEVVTPLVALTRPDSGGLVSVEGHVAAADPTGTAPLPNMVVHFGTLESAGQLDRVVDALERSRRSDAQTAIVAVLRASDLARVRHIPDVIYSEDQDGAWQRRLNARTSDVPATLIVDPRGTVVARHDGALEPTALAELFRRMLAPTKGVRTASLRSSARVGHAPPNFLFEPAPGRQLALRKLTGRPVALVFWRALAPVSIEAARTMTSRAVAEGSVPLAVNDGDAAEIARDVAWRHEFADALVIDPRREISRAYGVTAWPTVVLIDSRGVVSAVHSGHTGGGTADSPFQKLPVTRQGASR